LKPDPGRIPESAADGTAYQPSGGNLTYEDVVNAGLFLIVFLKALPNLRTKLGITSNILFYQNTQNFRVFQK
jgi:hypothetical protein